VFRVVLLLGLVFMCISMIWFGVVVFSICCIMVLMF